MLLINNTYESLSCEDMLINCSDHNNKNGPTTLKGGISNSRWSARILTSAKPTKVDLALWLWL